MKENSVFFIAEMSGNHNQSFDNAINLVEEASKTGASAIKLQTYTADTLTMKKAYQITSSKSLWKGYDLYDLYSKASTPWEWHKEIFLYAKKKGLVCFSTPFDESSVDFLEDLNNPIYKIASFEVNHYPLLKYIAKTKKPVIMSTGASMLSEIYEAVSILRNNGCNDLTLLKCTSNYPAKPKDANLLTLANMKSLFNCNVGLSDHTPGIGVSVAAVALGAKVIEKHFCLSRKLGGVDSKFSLEPDEFKALVNEGRRAFAAIGKIKYLNDVDVKKYQNGKRSIYIAKDIKKGQKFTKFNLRIIRPGFGIHPRAWEDILGKKAKKDLKSGTPMNYCDFL